jgi:HK97 family phage portal protein
MNLLSRIKRAFTSQRYLETSMQVVHGGDGKRQPFSALAAVNAYRSWIYAAANLNAVAVASQPIRLYVRRRGEQKSLWKTRRPGLRTKAYLAGDLSAQPSPRVMSKAAEYGDDYEVVTEMHPVLEVLSKFNPYTNGFDGTILRVLYTELTGNAYLHPVIDQTLGRPSELWVMPSQWIEIVPGKQKLIDGFLYGASREQRRFFPDDEVIHFKRPNPADLYYGLGKAEAAWGAAMANEAIHDMDLAFFANRARPDYLLTFKGVAAPEEIERLEVQIDEKLRGRQRTGRFLTMSSDVDLKPMGFPTKDLAGRVEIIEEIAAVFGVPVSMLKANDPNLASAQVGFASWKANTILPLLRMDEETLNQSLLPLFGIEDDAFLAYDNPVLADERFEFERVRAAVSGGLMTVNEARELQGLPASADEAAEKLLFNNAPLGGVPTPSLPLPPEATPSGPAGPGGGGEVTTPIDEPVAAEPEQAAAEVEPITTKGAKCSCQDARLTLGVHADAEEKAAGEDCVSDKIRTLLDEGYEQDQAVAIAISMCDRGNKALEDIDTKPPASVASNAARALEVRGEKPPSQRGMTAVGIARARDLANRVAVSEETIRRMAAYFERHEVDKQGATWDEQGAGWQAWNGWGGDEGRAWSRRKVEEFDRARKGEKAACGCGCAGGARISQKALWALGEDQPPSIRTKAKPNAQREFDDITDDEKRIAGAVDRVLQRQVSAVLKELRASSAPSAELTLKVESLLKSARWDRELVAALRPYLQASLQSGITLGSDTVKNLVTAVPDFTPDTANLDAYVRSESVRLARSSARSINQYTSVRVSKILGDGIETGETVEQLADRVQEWAGERGDAQRSTRSRAITIARTEAQRATRKAESEAWKSTGLVEGKTWLLAPDPCEFCEAVAAEFGQKSVGINDPFFKQGAVLTGADGGELALDYEAIDGPPLHPNCRCSMQPKLIDDYEQIIKDMEADAAAMSGPWEEA